MTEVLSQRGLGRATLARQYLLDRVAAPAVDVIEHLGGMQAQAPLAPYVGLWTRIQGFASALTEQRRVVRLHLMRATVHLASARDALDWRTLFYREPGRWPAWRGSPRSHDAGAWRHQWDGKDLPDDAGGRADNCQAQPRTVSAGVPAAAMMRCSAVTRCLVAAGG